MTWSIAGTGPVDRYTFAAQPWRPLADGFADRRAAEAWLRRNGPDADAVHFLLRVEPVPSGKPAGRPETWELFFVGPYGAIVSHRTGRRL